MKLYIKIAIGIVLFLAIAGIGTGLYLFNMKPRDLSKARPDFIMTSIDIQKAFDDNEGSATAKYVGKIIEITGEISAVKPGENSSVSISLKTGSAISSVICTFPAANKPAGAEPGKQVVIRGVCSGYLMDVLLNNCAMAR
jgi:hypothetical protein